MSFCILKDTLSLLTIFPSAKYPLAVVERLLDAFGRCIGGGYDIGCKFATTLKRSPLGPRATDLSYTSLIGSFHGHAHNRICQLSNLAHYVKGMGLEDLEGCERFFSKSNALASSLRYASAFHRQQKIVEFMKHMDVFETYHNLSKWSYFLFMYSCFHSQATGEFLVNNYYQALDILKGGPALEKTMLDQGIEGTDTFHVWLAEEHAYLKSLSKEPLQESLEMEYLQKLVNFQGSE